MSNPVLEMVRGGGGMKTEPEDKTDSALNPARDPKRKQRPGEAGSIGDVAFKDALILVGIAWLVLLFFAFSLRGHNI